MISNNGTPIKTRVINAINGALTTIDLFKNVIYRSSISYDLENNLHPVVFTYDLPTTGIQYNNQLRVEFFPFSIEIWTRNSSQDGLIAIGKEADIWQAEIYNYLIGINRPIFLNDAGVKISEQTTAIDKFIADDFTGGAVLNYDIEIRTDKKSLYSISAF